jgi:hypothetical protein
MSKVRITVFFRITNASPDNVENSSGSLWTGASRGRYLCRSDLETPSHAEALAWRDKGSDGEESAACLVVVLIRGRQPMGKAGSS